jgi:hypothetical protein
MVAYSFRQHFVDPIIAGSKQQTIRGPRRRHVRPGEELQLYYGLRTRGCFLIGRAACISAMPVFLDFSNALVVVDGRIVGDSAGLDAFARGDGFPLGWDGLRRFWLDEHGALDNFYGTLIRWRDFHGA